MPYLEYNNHNNLLRKKSKKVLVVPDRILEKQKSQNLPLRLWKLHLFDRIEELPFLICTFLLPFLPPYNV
jgi:hypothetical protein